MSDIVEENNPEYTKFELLDIFIDLDEDEMEAIEHWISSREYKKDLEYKRSLAKTEEILNNIGRALKKMVPFDAVMPSETLKLPKVGDLSDCQETNSIHIDEFLYDKIALDEKVLNKEISLSYCTDCKSRNVQELICVSHSMSKRTVMAIFKIILPENLEGKTVLDLGSRLGSVLYGAYYLSNASQIIGIEMNKEFCDIQEKMINQFSMDKERIKIIHSDVMDKSDIVATTDVIIINTVDFFLEEEKHIQMWHFLRDYLKKDCYVVLNRSIIETLKPLNIFDEFEGWLSPCKSSHVENERYFDEDEYADLYLYTVNELME